MKLIRCRKDDNVFHALLEGQTVRRLEGDIFDSPRPVGQPIALADVKLLAPVTPSKVVAVGKNYLDHVKEFGGPEPESIIIFIKPDTSVIGPGDTIIRPRGATRVDYEGELALVVGKTARNVSAADADKYILGYTCLNDVTERDMQALDKQWTRGKGFDTFCPIGPVVTDEIDPDNAEVSTTLNGVVKQHSNTSLMKWKVREILEFVSACMTLRPGDIITTGTPAGVGPLAAGDTVTVEVAGIGALTNPVADA